MLSRFIFRSSHLAALISSKKHLVVPLPIAQHPILSTPKHYFFPRTPHISHFSTNGNDGSSGDDESAASTTEVWKLSSEDQDVDSIFSVDSSNAEGVDEQDDNEKIADPVGAESWSFGKSEIVRGMGEKSAHRDDPATSTTDLWKMSSEDKDVDSIFSVDSSNTGGINEQDNNDKIADPSGDAGAESWSFVKSKIVRGMMEKSAHRVNVDQLIKEDSTQWNFSEEQKEGGNVDQLIMEDSTQWSLLEEQKEGGNEDSQLWSFSEEQKKQGEEDLFGVEEDKEHGTDEMEPGLEGAGAEKTEAEIELEMQEKALISVLKGPERAFGDLIASSGITDEMLDSLIALKDFEGIQGLPPLSEIEEMRYQKTTTKSSRYELELKKQEQAQTRVRKVDEQGRAYGLGKRKCSVAHVWINPGNGKFIVNGNEFDVYFPMIDQRATLLRPFSETKTLGLWDIKCTVKGGGTSGQVGAIRLGISRALQNWEPAFRPPLKQAGFLTRDTRIVERKKPGKAKARKSFQWVKR